MASRYSYIATAQKSTGVTHALVGSFTAPGELNLILGKTTRLEVHTVTPDGLQPVFSDALYGRIATMKLVRFQVRRCGGEQPLEHWELHLWPSIAPWRLRRATKKTA
jgi:hypothetical protein